MDRYMAFSVDQLQFLDSFQFTMQSLDSVVSTMDNEDLKYTHTAFPLEDQFYAMKKYGVFPYDFIDDISKITLNLSMAFPSRVAFFDKLADSEVQMKDYLHAKLVWDTRHFVTTMICIFSERFVTCLDSYGIDAAHYYSAHGMAWY